MNDTNKFYGLAMNDEKAEKALDYLKSTDEEAAILKAEAAYVDEMRKIKRSQLFMLFTGTVAEREAQAMSDDAYIEIVGALQLATEKFETMKNRRFTASEQIEIWRTESANKRSGNI